MKAKSTILCLVTCICASLLFAGLSSAMSAQSSSGGTLRVNRAANFGSRVDLVLSVDGQQVARLGVGRGYKGHLAPGRHQIVASVAPVRGRITPAQVSVNVQPGHTYSYTGAWHAGHLVLVEKK